MYIYIFVYAHTHIYICIPIQLCVPTKIFNIKNIKNEIVDLRTTDFFFWEQQRCTYWYSDSCTQVHHLSCGSACFPTRFLEQFFFGAIFFQFASCGRRQSKFLTHFKVWVRFAIPYIWGFPVLSQLFRPASAAAESPICFQRLAFFPICYLPCLIQFLIIFSTFGGCMSQCSEFVR